MKASLFQLTLAMALFAVFLTDHTTDAKSLRQTTYTISDRQLEDANENQDADEEAEGQDENEQEQEENEQEQNDDDKEENEGDADADDGYNYEGGYNNNNYGDETGTGILDTTPRNWNVTDWFLIAGILVLWGAITSCFCEAWWCCNCFRAAERKIYENRKMPSVIKDPVNNPEEGYSAM